MDPKECLLRMRTAYDARDREEFDAAAKDYRQWRRNGGFEPDMRANETCEPYVGDSYFYALLVTPWAREGERSNVIG